MKGFFPFKFNFIFEKYLGMIIYVTLCICIKFVFLYFDHHLLISTEYSFFCSQKEKETVYVKANDATRIFSCDKDSGSSQLLFIVENVNYDDNIFSS